MNKMMIVVALVLLVLVGIAQIPIPQNSLTTYIVEGEYCFVWGDQTITECHRLMFVRETIQQLLFPVCPDVVFIDNPAFYLVEDSCEAGVSLG